MKSHAERARGRRGERMPLQLTGRGMATDYARALLVSLGMQANSSEGPDDDEPWRAWARSGLMALTGHLDGPSQMCPVPLASCADGAIKALDCFASTIRTRARTGASAALLPTGSVLLGERAAIAGLHRHGTIAPGSGCRVLQAAESWFAISLTREADWSDVPAWLEDEHVRSWEAITTAVASRDAATLVERARLLGLAACISAPPAQTPKPWCVATRLGAPASPGLRPDPPKVVDLSSLWAGPLCSHLLQQLGACVVKVESPGRPDGARSGPVAFHDLMNHGKRSVALTFDTHGIARLHELLDWADIVIEASRPRGLRQLGVIAEQCIARRHGLTWISITGYGRDEPEGSWTAFGDDAGVAAGLSSLMQLVTGQPLVCGDAIADPLTGMHAALAALASYQSGGGCLVSLALRDVVAHSIGFSRPSRDADLIERWRTWTAAARGHGLDETPPTARPVTGSARALGADNDLALAGWNDPC